MTNDIAQEEGEEALEGIMKLNLSKAMLVVARLGVCVPTDLHRRAPTTQPQIHPPSTSAKTISNSESAMG